MPFSPTTAVQLGSLISVAYGLPVSQVPCNPNTNLNDPTVSLLNFIYADDPWDSKTGYVPYGVMVRSNGNPASIIIALRGTEEVWDWFTDFEFWRQTCSVPGAPPGAETERGFTTLFDTLRVAPTAAAAPLGVTVRGWLNAPVTVDNIYVTGHSLGGALATLVAAELAALNLGIPVTLYTFASPAVGESTFTDWFDGLVPNAYRICNAMDIVPNTPPPLLGYRHVEEVCMVNSGLVTKPSIDCHHALNTYLYLLDPSRFSLGACKAP